eukprot:12903757-Prorocentrum_lima.AAC.1
MAINIITGMQGHSWKKVMLIRTAQMMWYAVRVEDSTRQEDHNKGVVDGANMMDRVAAARAIASA